MSGTSTSKRRRVLWGSQSDETLVGTWATPPFSLPVQSTTYQEQWEERRQRTPVHVDVLALASCEGLLVACTSLGQVFVWKDKSGTAVATNGDSKSNFNSRLGGACLESTSRHFQVSLHPLKAIQIMPMAAKSNNQDHVILVGGKEGLWTISLTNHSNLQANKWDTVTCDVKQILVDADRVFVLNELGEIKVYGLPDNKLADTIDLNGSLATTMALAGSSDDVLSDREDDSESMDIAKPLLIGTSDSKILVWTKTTTSASRIESIGLHESDASKFESSSGTGCIGSLPFEIMVTSIHCTQDNWWIIAGICRNKKSSNRTILATLHGSTRTLISHKVLHETIYGIHYESQSSRLYTIGNDGVVSVWDSPYRLELMQRLWSSSPCGRAVVKIGSSSGVAVAGIGSKIDLFENDCRIQSLLVDDDSTSRS